MAPRRVAIVPHTHWDREWYEPFQTFRLRLVEVLDQLLDLLESDPSYARFLLDGQLAVVDDYLEVRPENEERLRRLAAAGRIELGPWYILMDEFLVSGETIVRDLQLGIRRGAAFGGVTEVGYLPDMFGHVAQMPQLLSLAGFAHAVVWRGVPSTIESSGFWWIAPDGTRVRAEYLLDGYGNGAQLPDDAKAVLQRVADHVTSFGSFLRGDVLFMNGSDHLSPQPFLGRVVAEANALQDDVVLELSSLRDHVAAAPTDGLPEWTGELRSGARANVLMGVASNHVDVKRAAALTEEALERRAEPLAAMCLGAWPRAELDLAWREVIRNAAHDSICACSVDEVILAVLHRYAEARQVADGVASRALRALGAAAPRGGYVVANTRARTRGGLVELVLAGGDPALERLQVVRESTALPGELVFDTSTARTLLGMIQSPRLNDDAWIEDVAVEDLGDEVVLTVRLGAFERPDVKLDQVRARITALLDERPSVTVRVRLDQPPIRRVLARAEPVDGLGWRAFEAAALSNPVTGTDDAGRVALDNGLVRVEVDPVTGTFSLDGIAGFGRLVDGGDLGDSYNYSPPPHDRLVDTPERVDVVLTERGPVRASALVVATYRWPDRVDELSGTRTGERVVEVATVLSVLADDPLVRVTTTFVNPSRDHRLRVHFPTAAPAPHSRAECAFGTVRRALVAEGRPGEFGLPTFPSRRFVQAGRLTVVHRGLHEYEVVDVDDDAQAGHGLAVTVLRATGMLSRLGMALRPLPAGPLTPVEGLQLVGATITAEYAVGLDVADPYAACDDVLSPLELTTAPGGGGGAASGRLVEVHGAEVSSVQLADGLVELRVFNPQEAPTEVVVVGRRGYEVDLRGRQVRGFEERLELRGCGIATLRLAPLS